MPIKQVSPSEVYSLAQEKGQNSLTLIDVREVDEYAALSTQMAENIPLSAFDPHALLGRFPKEQPLYLICRSGQRSMHAAQALASCGFQQLFNVAGGMLAWEHEGLPTRSATSS